MRNDGNHKDISSIYPHNELHRVPADLSKFWVITVLSNSCRYKRRYELYWRFAEMCEHAGVKLVTVEQAFGDRQFMVTSPSNPFHLQVRSIEELWHKENMINLGIKHACAIAPTMGLEVKEVAWVDADCRPTRTPKDWFDATWHELQHYHFVQMWEYLLDLDYNQNPIGPAQPGFMANYIKYGSPSPEEFRYIQKHRLPLGQHHPEPYPYGLDKKGATVFGRPGLAWASSIDALNKVGGLLDVCVLGSADWHMAHGLIGSMEVTYTSDRGANAYGECLLRWQERAERWIKRDVGYVPGTVYHDFHGKKSNRGYGTRGKILSENYYNPLTDIKYDSQGVLQLETWEPRQIKLRDQIRAYFRSRNEDEIS